MAELKDKRTYTTKKFDEGNSVFKTNSYSGIKHYENKLQIGDGDNSYLREIDKSLIWDEDTQGWTFLYSNYHPFIPKYSDQTITFRDLYKSKDQTLSYTPECEHVEGELINNQIVYSNAFGVGADLILVPSWEGIQKIVKITSAYEGNHIFRFEVDLPENVTFEGVKINDDYTYVNPLKVWDNNIEVVLPIQWSEEDGKLFLVKDLTQIDLEQFTGDIYTDTITSIDYTAANSNQLLSDGKATYTLARDAATGTVNDLGTGTEHNLLHNSNITTFFVRRAQFTFDTSSITDTDIPSALTLTMYSASAQSADNDTDTVVALDNTNNLNVNVPLQSEDFDDFGSVSIGSRVLADYVNKNANVEMTLTDFDVLDFTGNTVIGLRLLHDIDDNSPLGTNVIRISTAEDLPFITVTHAPPAVVSFKPKIILV